MNICQWVKRERLALMACKFKHLFQFPHVETSHVGKCISGRATPSNSSSTYELRSLPVTSSQRQSIKNSSSQTGKHHNTWCSHWDNPISGILWRNFLLPVGYCIVNIEGWRRCCEYINVITFCRKTSDFLIKIAFSDQLESKLSSSINTYDIRHILVGRQGDVQDRLQWSTKYRTSWNIESCPTLTLNESDSRTHKDSILLHPDSKKHTYTYSHTYTITNCKHIRDTSLYVLVYVYISYQFLVLAWALRASKCKPLWLHALNVPQPCHWQLHKHMNVIYFHILTSTPWYIS